MIFFIFPDLIYADKDKKNLQKRNIQDLCLNGTKGT